MQKSSPIWGDFCSLLAFSWEERLCKRCQPFRPDSDQLHMETVACLICTVCNLFIQYGLVFEALGNSAFLLLLAQPLRFLGSYK